MFSDTVPSPYRTNRITLRNEASSSTPPVPPTYCAGSVTMRPTTSLFGSSQARPASSVTVVANAFHEEADDVRDFSDACAARATRRDIVVDVEDDHAAYSRTRHPLSTGHGSLATICCRVPHRGAGPVQQGSRHRASRAHSVPRLHIDATVWFITGGARIARCGNADRLGIAGSQPVFDVVATAIPSTSGKRAAPSLSSSSRRCHP